MTILPSSANPADPAHADGHRHHDHEHDHGTPAAPDMAKPNFSLLQVSATVRLVGAISLLLPLWIAVYGLVK